MVNIAERECREGGKDDGEVVPVGIEEVMAVAITRGGLSVGDFDLLTLSEWATVAAAICKKEESRERLEWERMRLLFYASLAPHISGRKSPKDLLPLYWDNEIEKDDSPPPTEEEIKRMIERFGKD